MDGPEIRNLAAWSRAVRESSLKRLRVVGQHLIDADEWLFRKLEERALEPMVGRAGVAGEVT